MSQVAQFLNEAKTFFIATTDKDQPRLRPFGGAGVYNGRVYLSTSNDKNVYNQIQDNPKIEVVAMNSGKWIRVSGRAIIDHSREAKEVMLASNPYLKNNFQGQEDKLAVFYIDDMKAVINSFGGDTQVLEN